MTRILPRRPASETARGVASWSAAARFASTQDPNSRISDPETCRDPPRNTSHALAAHILIPLIAIEATSRAPPIAGQTLDSHLVRRARFRRRARPRHRGCGLPDDSSVARQHPTRQHDRLVSNAVGAHARRRHGAVARRQRVLPRDDGVPGVRVQQRRWRLRAHFVRHDEQLHARRRPRVARGHPRLVDDLHRLVVVPAARRLLSGRRRHLCRRRARECYGVCVRSTTNRRSHLKSPPSPPLAVCRASTKWASGRRRRRRR